MMVLCFGQKTIFLRAPWVKFSVVRYLRFIFQCCKIISVCGFEGKQRVVERVVLSWLEFPGSFFNHLKDGNTNFSLLMPCNTICLLWLFGFLFVCLLGGLLRQGFPVSSGRPGIDSVVQDDLELRNPPTSVPPLSPVIGLQVYATTAQLSHLFSTPRKDGSASCCIAPLTGTNDGPKKGSESSVVPASASSR